jgi:hypothetical protein
MTNAIYDIARYRFATAAIDWRAADLTLVAWGSPPDFDPADEDVAAITARGNAELSRSLAITSKTVDTPGDLQTNIVVIPAIAAGPTIRWFTMCLVGITPSQAVPLLFIDNAENLPFVCNGLDILVQPNWAENQSWGRL